MSVLQHDTMIVVADSEKALFLVNVTDAEDPFFEVMDIEMEDNPPDREQAANRRGRNFQSAGARRHAYDDTDFHELQKDRFAADLAERLYKMAHAGKYDRLVLVASPQVLGVVREEMHKEVEDRLVATVDKTLTNHPMDEIEKIVRESVETTETAA